MTIAQEPLRDDLLRWIAARSYTRAQAAEALGLKITTLHGYLAGRPCRLEPTLRLLMARLD